MPTDLSDLDCRILRFLCEQNLSGYNGMHMLIEQETGLSIDPVLFFEAVNALEDQGLLVADLVQADDEQMRGGHVTLIDRLSALQLLSAHTSTRGRRRRPSALAQGPNRLAVAV